jgi:hypothetical protein
MSNDKKMRIGYLCVNDTTSRERTRLKERGREKKGKNVGREVYKIRIG